MEIMMNNNTQLPFACDVPFSLPDTYCLTEATSKVSYIKSEAEATKLHIKGILNPDDNATSEEEFDLLKMQRKLDLSAAECRELESQLHAMYDNQVLILDQLHESRNKVKMLEKRLEDAAMERKSSLHGKQKEFNHAAALKQVLETHAANPKGCIVALQELVEVLGQMLKHAYDERQALNDKVENMEKDWLYLMKHFQESFSALEQLKEVTTEDNFNVEHSEHTSTTSTIASIGRKRFKSFSGFFGIGNSKNDGEKDKEKKEKPNWSKCRSVPTLTSKVELPAELDSLAQNKQIHQRGRSLPLRQLSLKCLNILHRDEEVFELRNTEQDAEYDGISF
jgi:hypothetical protein